MREFVLARREAGGWDGRLPTSPLRARLRDRFRTRTRPLADAALAAGLTPNAATLLQLVSSLTCAFAYARGALFTGGWLLILSGTLDVLDGEMARRSGCDGPRGAFMDSVVDRYGEAIVFSGLVVLYRDEWVLWLVLWAWAGSFLVSYTRARAESLGVECREGFLQRPERYVILGGASMGGALMEFLTCGVDKGRSVMTAGVATLAVLANVTAAQRIRRTLRRLP
ncbi:MAG: CDP-alcohol phosphatidyltransferase family protein [Dehalococcoidia bacterium]|nr:CDP-alcohol phosphatidyltransferase family protein [Dehalococcoidia bacterium]